MQYSTGSTGASKRVVRTHAMLAGEAAALTRALGITRRDRILAMVPLCHSFGFMHAMVCALCSGATIVTCDTFFAREIVRLVKEEEVTGFPAVPFVWERLVTLRGGGDLSSLRYALSAGAPLAEETARDVAAKYGIRISQVYGSTETGVMALNHGIEPAPAATSVGRPLPGGSVSVLGEGGAPLAPGEEGDVVAHSPYAAQAYEGVVARSETWFRGDLFFTGDVGRLDEAGCLTLTGRRRRFINVAGSKVDPAEVEDALRQHPAVVDVAVVALADGPSSEKVKAVLVTREPCTRDDVLQHCRQRLADFKIPRLIEFRAELPRSPLGKLLRKDLLGDGPA